MFKQKISSILRCENVILNLTLQFGDCCELYCCNVNSVNELLKIKEELTKERDEQLQEITKLREQLADTGNQLAKMEEDKSQAEQNIQEVNFTREFI